MVVVSNSTVELPVNIQKIVTLIETAVTIKIMVNWLFRDVNFDEHMRNMLK